ncbi:MAG: hypothetical protein R3B93_27490 [Bacteroidia bacterium]
MNFFNTNCTETPRTDSEFGICDDQNNAKAYTDSTNKEKWIVIVKNEANQSIVFTPIDNCIIVLKPGSSDKESTCDGMLTFRDSLFLVELKVQRTGEWITRAIGQLENTVQILLKYHYADLQNIKYKKVYACNRKHPRFTVIDNERNKRFFQKYGFRIDVQAEIVV